MSVCLGLDTSNYTTSAALFDTETGTVLQNKMLLPVGENQLGLRQSDAVFYHTKQLPEILTKLFDRTDMKPAAVAASVRPRNAEGSYMPCFLCGEGMARSISAVNHIPFFSTSHQIGHVLAALYSAKKLFWRHQRFLAFHVSGGTTDCLLIEPDEQEIIRATRIASSLDLKAGQAVDRVGLMLGLRFPCGTELERLAAGSVRDYKIRPVLKGADCCLSGIENQCAKMLQDGNPGADIARYCLQYIAAALEGMTQEVLEAYGSLPLLYAGGVMSNLYIKDKIQLRFSAEFAEPAFSCDNAAGIAVFAALKGGYDA